MGFFSRVFGGGSKPGPKPSPAFRSTMRKLKRQGVKANGRGKTRQNRLSGETAHIVRFLSTKH